MPRWQSLLLGCALLAGCERAQDPEPEPVPTTRPTQASPAQVESPTPTATPTRTPLIDEAIALREWARAENRETCVPLALTDDGDAGGTARRANFSGGWAVAFDRPGLRSAYGFAGAGVEAADREALAAQWPSLRSLDGPAAGLLAGSVAGYGLVGAQPFPDDVPEARGRDLLAYLAIPAQGCMYNVWSKLGRTHLEHLLDHLRIIETSKNNDM